MRKVIFVGWATPSEIEEKADLLALEEADGTYSVVKNRFGDAGNKLTKDAIVDLLADL